MWIDAYNNAVHKQCSTTITARIDAACLWFINDPRSKREIKNEQTNPSSANLRPGRQSDERQGILPQRDMSMSQDANGGDIGSVDVDNR